MLALQYILDVNYNVLVGHCRRLHIVYSALCSKHPFCTQFCCRCSVLTLIYRYCLSLQPRNENKTILAKHTKKKHCKMGGVQYWLVKRNVRFS